MLNTAFTLLGAAVTWLEVIAFVLALANIACNVYEVHWGWPLSIAASLLYAWLFFESKLYGETGVNLFFAVSSVWGWWQWVRGSRASTGEALQIAQLDRRGVLLCLAGFGALWLIFALLLRNVTDSDVPWADGFVTAGSVIGTVLLGRKYMENWPVWVVVNTASVGLFAYKGLTLTVVLYGLFLLLAVWGWVGWRQRLQAQSTEQAAL